MRLWIDDVRPAPADYDLFHADIWCRSVKFAKEVIEIYGDKIELIDIDHDAGEYAKDGGDYIRLLDWLEETGRKYPIRIHSMNVVGRMNMERIIQRNGWEEIQ